MENKAVTKTTRRLAQHEIDALSREDMLTLIGPSMMKPEELTDAQLREVVSALWFLK